MSPRKRLDLLLVERGLAENHEHAQRLIRAGLVHTENARLEKPGHLLDPDTPLAVKGSDCPYVSRGGLKLEGALDSFGVDVEDIVALDLGASTGGFTDCLLQRGARLVYAIDVGRGQLHRRLETDDRVVKRERTHLDTLERDQFDPPPTLAVADLSFISLRRAYPVLTRVLPKNAQAVLLVKPQFEIGRGRLPNGGVLTDESLQLEVVEELEQAAREAGFTVLARRESPILGGDGNREFFLHLRLAP